MRKRFGRRTWIVLSAVSVLMLLVGIAGVTAKMRHTNQVEAAHAARVTSARASARAAAAAAAKEAQHRADALTAKRAAKRAADNHKRSVRHLVVRELQKSVTKDARRRVDDGVLDGPIFSTQCAPVGGGSTDDLTAITGKFECLAIDKKNDDGTVEGYVFSSTVNWKDFSYAWQLGR